MKQRKSYPVNQSPLYKISNHKLLAKTLCVKPYTLKRVIKRGDKNYKLGSTDNGRAIQIPKAQILRIHKRINDLINRIEKPHYLVSGVKGRSHVYNAKMHIGDVAVAKTDIERYYPSTTKEIIKKGFRKKFCCSEDIAETLASLCTVSGHIPTGSPLSQSLSFIVNSPIFDEIDKYSKARNITFSLYVDDLTFSGKTIPKHFLAHISNLLKKKRGYKCHKFRTYNRETEKVITGVVVRQNGIDLKRTQKEIISNLSRKKVYFSQPEKINDPKNIKYYQKFIGHLFSAGEISPRYRQIGRTVVSERKHLGIQAQNQNNIGT
ncbi:reverse transcriptase family protein [Halomonas pacifica]|uniref:reverse transcriptase family protein n=1 Tax=Bisbaumannia pacifica TaxID=77098 RepID=UPI00235A20D4|nr:reverse transcriptase family protein [Halomonas pacifica]MDC8802435.1 reverse transcriptase family protein [Halomonas pacifica]